MRKKWKQKIRKSKVCVQPSIPCTQDMAQKNVFSGCIQSTNKSIDDETTFSFLYQDTNFNSKVGVLYYVNMVDPLESASQ